MIYLELFLTFLQIGAVSFGGGYGMISLIREKVLAHGLSLIHILTFSDCGYCCCRRLNRRRRKVCNSKLSIVLLCFLPFYF